MAQFDAQGTLYISYEDWYEFVQKKFPFLQGGQFVLGNPRQGVSDLEIDYALGTDDVHPQEWSVKPQWLTEQLKSRR